MGGVTTYSGNPNYSMPNPPLPAAASVTRAYLVNHDEHHLHRVVRGFGGDVKALKNQEEVDGDMRELLKRLEDLNKKENGNDMQYLAYLEQVLSRHAERTKNSE